MSVFSRLAHLFDGCFSSNPFQRDRNTVSNALILRIFFLINWKCEFRAFAGRFYQKLPVDLRSASEPEHPIASRAFLPRRL